jgi:hypothetical protein
MKKFIMTMVALLTAVTGVKAMGYDCNLKATKPSPQNDDALERCLSQFSKCYFKNKL